MPNDVCSGHRIGTAEVESALVSHPQCAEAAVVGVEHEVYFRHVCVCGGGGRNGKNGDCTVDKVTSVLASFHV